MKKILLRAPLLTNSGYGVHSRQVFKWLNQIEEIDLKCELLPWGRNPWILDLQYDSSIIKKIIDKSIDKKEISEINFDQTYQVQLPNEWTKISSYDVGITAGIESDYCNKNIIRHLNKMDSIIVTSTYSKNTFLNTAKINKMPLKEIKVVSESFPELFFLEESIDAIKLKSDFNFLVFGQITHSSEKNDRKNTLKTIKSLISVFKDNKDVGIIIKTNLGKNSKIDRKYTKKLIESYIGNLNIDRKCKIYLVHENLSQKDIVKLYNTANVFVSGTRAEGYGLTHLEAASLGVPIISTGYSGYEDFLKDNYLKVNYKLEKINFNSNLIENGLSSWAEFEENDMKEKLEDIFKNYETYKKVSIDYKKTIKQNYNIQSIINSYRSIARV